MQHQVKGNLQVYEDMTATLKAFLAQKSDTEYLPRSTYSSSETRVFQQLSLLSYTRILRGLSSALPCLYGLEDWCTTASFRSLGV